LTITFQRGGIVCGATGGGGGGPQSFAPGGRGRMAGRDRALPAGSRLRPLRLADWRPSWLSFRLRSSPATWAESASR
jgi:hypothetical protein